MAEEFKPGYNFSDDRLNELLQLFPEAFEDGKFNVDTLKELIGDYSTDSTVSEHFGLNWVGKKDARRIAAKPPTGTLKPIIGEGVNEESTKNLFIEGDNLEVLKILRKSYAGRIKMIYIDPPYNTGNDFIYKDDFSDSTEDYLRKSGEKSEEGLLVSNPKTTGRFHGSWLCFMYPRLRIAKDFLSDTGVIYISIDHNEVENLKSICNDIFGEENYRGTIVRATGQTTGQDSGGLGASFDYCLVYTKNPNIELSGLPLNAKDLKRFESKDEKGFYSLDQMRKTGSSDRRSDRPNMYYPVLDPEGNEVYPIGPGGYESRWRFAKTTYDENITKNMIVWKKTKKEGLEVWWPYVKYYAEGRTKRPSPLWDDLDGNKKAARDLRDLFDGDKVFDFPKPIPFINRLMDICPELNEEEEYICLDFFAGSGTTAHSVYRWNGINKSNRWSHIVVQIPQLIKDNTSTDKNAIKLLKSLEKDINISELAKERLKRSLKLEESEDGYKVFKQNTSTIYKWQDFDPDKGEGISALKTQMELAFKNPIQDGTSVDDFVTEILLNEGFPLTANKEDIGNGIYKISHDWVPYALFITMSDALLKDAIDSLTIDEKDHFVCLDKAFQQNDSLKQILDNKCKLFTI